MASSKALSALVLNADSVIFKMPSSVSLYSTSTTSTDRRVRVTSTFTSPRSTVRVTSVPSSPRTMEVTLVVSMP